MDDKQFPDIRSQLDDSKARLISPNNAPILDSKEVTVYYPCSDRDMVGACCEYIHAYGLPKEGGSEKAQHYRVDPSMGEGREPLPGIWRIVAARGAERGQEGGVYVTMRKGFLQTLLSGAAIDWSEAHCVDAIESPGNTQAISGVSNTTSNNPEEALIVRFRNLDRSKFKAMRTELAATTFTDPAIDGVIHTGTWHKVLVHAYEGDDGSGVLDVMLARPQYTLPGFRNSNTQQEESIGYLWQVPKPLADGIITAWDSASAVGRSATASYSAGTHLVDIILTAPVGVNDNLTTNWIPVACDTWKRFHFGWGYTKTELNAFIAAHDDAIPGAAVGTPALIVRSRQVTETLRGDGFYNATIEEISWAHKSGDAVTPEVTIYVSTGTKILRQQSYGYNWAKDEISVEAFQKLWYDTAAAVGKTIEFELTREDDCSFDWRAVITTQTAKIERAVTTKQTASKGIINKSTSIIGIGKDDGIVDELADLEDALEASIVKSIDLNVKARPDELADVEINERTVVATEGKAITIGDLTLTVGRNAGALPGSNSALVPATMSVNPQDGGGLEYAIGTRPLHTLNETVTDGHATETIGENLTAIKMLPDGEVLDGASASIGDIGKVNSRIKSHKLVAAANAVAGTVAKGRRYVQDGINQESVPAPTGARLLSASVSLGEKGRLNYSITSEAIDATEGTLRHRGGTVYYGVNADELPVDGDTETLMSVSVSADDNGKLTYRIETDDPPDETATVTHGAALATIETEVHSAATTEPVTTTPQDGETIRIAVEPLPNKRFRWRRDTETSVEFVAPTQTIQRELFTETIKKARNARTLPTITPSATKEALLDFAIRDDKTYDYTLLERDFSASQLTELGNLLIDYTEVRQHKDTIIKQWTTWVMDTKKWTLSMLVWRRKRTISKSITRRYYGSAQASMPVIPPLTSAGQVKYEQNRVGEHLWAFDTIRISEGDWAPDTTYGKDGVKLISSDN